MERIEISDAYCGDHGDGVDVEATTSCGRRFHYRGVELNGDWEFAKRVVRLVLEAGSINPEHWNEGYPVYGSSRFEAEERGASLWAARVREGFCDLDSVPDCYRTLL